MTGTTQLHVLGGWVTKELDATNQGTKRDFTGANARLVTNWSVTKEVSVKFNGWREIGGVEDLTANYALNRGVSLASSWDVSPKIRIEAMYKEEQRNYNSVSVLAGLAASEREDQYKGISMRREERSGGKEGRARW